MRFTRVFHFVLDLLLPVRCLVCRKSNLAKQGHLHLCFSCLDKVKLQIEPECAFCSARSVNGQTCPFCREKHDLDFLWAATNYQEPIVKKMLWAFKYRFIFNLKIPLTRLIITYLRQKKFDKFLENYREQILLIPVPLHRYRLNWRSYNQSELLTQELAKEFNLKIETNILIRWEHKKPQTEINEKTERMENVKNIFSCQEQEVEKIKGKTMVLVDDISTTGSTLNEAAKVLKQAGAEKVIGLVVAKG